MSLFKKLDFFIIAHWTEESGYSFPSGHTGSAFLLATLLSYLLYTRGNSRWSRLYVVPIIWAILVGLSRVAVGAHTANDVTAGALMGILLSSIMIHTQLLDKLVSSE